MIGRMEILTSSAGACDADTDLLMDLVTDLVTDLAPPPLDTLETLEVLPSSLSLSVDTATTSSTSVPAFFLLLGPWKNYKQHVKHLSTHQHTESNFLICDIWRNVHKMFKCYLQGLLIFPSVGGCGPSRRPSSVTPTYLWRRETVCRNPTPLAC